MKDTRLLKALLFMTMITMNIEMKSQDNLILIRERLHAIPEYSHKEEKTAEAVLEYLSKTDPDRLFKNVGGYGIIAEYKGNHPGPSKMFRCELDAIKTESGFKHLCGHDGHMAIILGLAQRLRENRDFAGTIYLLFQPAEEVGEGAALMIKDMKGMNLKFDYVFALHNNPNYELNKVIIHRGTYAAASVGMELRFAGEASHAAYPEQAHSPTDAIFSVISELKRLNNSTGIFDGFVLSTVVNVEIGEANYGVTPGDGVLRLTLRGFKDAGLEKLCSTVEGLATGFAKRDKLNLCVSYHDRFPATVNTDVANSMVVKAAESTGHEIIYTDEPGRGSDDFCHFTTGAQASYFDIGNGKEAPDIHKPDYRFSDEILSPSLDILDYLVFRM
ncbi:MAG: amidohydrolase [Bacteroidales bacterium]|nr:amidohydrolase [Bacteroidales bacterium]